jgi:hypothetical protein
LGPQKICRSILQDFVDSRRCTAANFCTPLKVERVNGGLIQRLGFAVLTGNSFDQDR